jgi:hypothetical protein
MKGERMMSKKNGRTGKTLRYPLHLQQAVMEAMIKTFQRGAMGFGEELA